jgi:putative hydrolase of the HAD superfamily
MALTAPTPTEYEDEICDYLAAIKALPSLRAGVTDTLKRARELAVEVTVVSEEKKERCVARLAAHGLSNLVKEVVSAPKTVQLFRELRASGAAGRCVMVGDQPDRDIAPAKRAGFECYLYPSEFTPFWSKQSRAQPARVINRFDDLVAVIEGREAPTRTPSEAAPL